MAKWIFQCPVNHPWMLIAQASEVRTWHVVVFNMLLPPITGNYCKCKKEIYIFSTSPELLLIPLPCHQPNRWNDNRHKQELMDYYIFLMFVKQNQQQLFRQHGAIPCHKVTPQDDFAYLVYSRGSPASLIVSSCEIKDNISSKKWIWVGKCKVTVECYKVHFYTHERFLETLTLMENLDANKNKGINGWKGKDFLRHV